jgi:hypothetical protein
MAIYHGQRSGLTNSKPVLAILAADLKIGGE